MGAKQLLTGACAAALFFISSCTYYFGPNRLVMHFKSEPATVPDVYDYHNSFAARADYNINDPLITFYADRQLPDKEKAKHSDIARIIIAKLMQKREVEQINTLLMQLVPWSEHGTQWALHKHGDYDFTEISWCSLLYLFGQQADVLYPATRSHLVNVLIANSGAKHALRTPGSAGLFRETENHILMGEISRYLKNQWLHEHGDTAVAFDNHKNGMENWMLNHLDEKFRGGFYEFNSDPYSGYTIAAINTLFSFTHSDTVRNGANKLLNELMYEYSLGSINQTRHPPFRRQIHRSSRTAFDTDPVSSIVRELVALKTGKPLYVAEKQHALIALLLHYRLNNSLVSCLTQKNQNYFALLGHGRKGSPEIYTGGPGFVLSAGGVQRGKVSQLAPRPTMLLLNDHVMQRDSCFYICSRGKMKQWNNTGVYQNFACTNDSLHIPPQYSPVYEKDNWKIFEFKDMGLDIITYHQNGVALLLVMEGTKTTNAGLLLDAVIINNKDNDLKKQFTAPGPGMVKYDLNSNKNMWVIKAIDGKSLDRKFDQWPRQMVKYRDHPGKV